MKIYKDFNDYLNEKFFIDEPMTLDDDWIDAFNAWIVNQDIDEIINWGDDYAKVKLERQGEAITSLKRALKRCLVSAERSYQDSNLATAIRAALREAGEVEV